MPELPEVQTTVDGINAEVKGLTITDVWTSYNSPFYYGKDDIKNPKYVAKFKEKVIDGMIDKFKYKEEEANDDARRLYSRRHPQGAC